MARNPIVVIGAGIGGLTLGRCLRQKGIPFTLYEKASQSPRHNYGITLEPSVYKPLLKMLNVDFGTFHRMTSVGSLWQNSNTAAPPTYNDTAPFRANRSALEALISEDIRDQIVYESNLTAIEMSSDGANSLLLTFNDAEKVTSNFAIDCTGVHSPVRYALVPLGRRRPAILPYVVINGKRYLDEDTFNDVYLPYLNDANQWTAEMKLQPDAKAEPILLQVSLNGHDPSVQKVSISWTYSRAARQEAEDALYLPNRHNKDASSIPAAFFEELAAISKSATLPPAFADAFNLSKVRNDRLLHWLMRTVLPHQSDLDRPRELGMMMMGDAVHATPILGSRGANFATADALVLAEVIAKAWNETNSEEEVEERLRKVAKEFYKSQYPLWSHESLQSKDYIAEMHEGEESKAVL